MGASLQSCPCMRRDGIRLQREPARAAVDVEDVSKADKRNLERMARKQMQRETFAVKKREKKREQRHRKQSARQERLAAMTEEERDEFVKKEKSELAALKQEEQECLQHAFNAGFPKVVINCSFADAMDYKELTSLAKQLQLSYTAVRDLRSPIQLHFTSLHSDNPSLHSLGAIGYKKWLVHVHEESTFDVFDVHRLVILSPDAEEDLDEVKPDYIYVIGGLVDRTIKKNQTKAQAEAHGVPMLRKLPIKSFGPPGMFPILNIDVVVSILHERFTQGPTSDWREILLKCMPQRQQPGPTRRMLRKQRKADRKSAAVDTENAMEDDSSREASSAMELDADGASCEENPGSQTAHDDSPGHAQRVHAALRQGTEIEIVGFGHAKIISLGLLPQGKHKGKYKIRYNDDGSLYHVHPEQIARVVEP